MILPAHWPPGRSIQIYSGRSNHRPIVLATQTRPFLQSCKKPRSFRQFPPRSKRSSLSVSAKAIEEPSPTHSGTQDDEEELVKGIKLGRRTLQVTFTCNKCGERTARLVNPLAWQKGLVFAQCSGCDVWHKLRDNEGLVDEVKFTD